MLTTSLPSFSSVAIHYITADVYTYKFIASDSSSVAVGAAIGGFIGGVLLTATIAGCLATAVFYRGKREQTTVAKTR